MISYDALRAIITMSITGSILAIILFALKPLVKNRLPKSAQYYLWLVVLAGMAIPVSRIALLPETAAPLATISNTVNRYVVTTQDIRERLEPYRILSAAGFYGISETGLALIPSAWIPEAFDWFRYIHLLGLFAYPAFVCYSYKTFITRTKKRNKEATAGENAMLSALCGDSRAPALYRNPLAATPMLIGIFSPAIVLPDREYTDTQLRAVLLHELTHLRRNDILIKWLSVFVTALHWFNPIVWLIRREIDRACELACDEAVITSFDVDDKQNYGDTLLYVAADSKTHYAV